MKRLLALILIATLLCIPLAGCGNKETSKGDDEGDKITYALSGEPEELDPTKNIYARSSLVLQNLFRGLYKIDENNKPVPAIAESYTLDESGTVYTFTLRDGVKWSDGKELTAEDFEYSWKRALNPETASAAAYEFYYLKNGKAYNEGEAEADDVGVKAIDKKTLEVTLEYPTAYFLDKLCTATFCPVRKDVVEGNESWTKSTDTYVCNGPFMFKEMKPKEKFVLVKNPNYIDADKVKLDTLEIVFIESPEAELAAYTNDEIDVSDNVSNEAMTKYMDTEEFYSEERIGFYYLDVNCEKEPFDDPRVRKAFAMAINREQIIKNIIQSTEEPAFGFIPYGIPDGVETDKDYRDVVGNAFEEDYEEARKLLEEAGYPNGEGMPEIIFITMASQSNVDVAQALQSMWKENLGVEVSIQTFESKVYWDELHEGNCHMARDGWTGDYPDPMSTLEIFVDTDTNVRWYGEGSEEFDRLLDENMKTIDQNVRMENFVKAEKILADEMPAIPIYFYQDQYLCKPHVKGVMKNYIGHTIFEYAYIEK